MTFEKPLAAGALDFGVDPSSTEDGGDALPPFAPAPPRPSAPNQALAKLPLTDMSPPQGCVRGHPTAARARNPIL